MIEFHLPVLPPCPLPLHRLLIPAHRFIPASSVSAGTGRRLPPRRWVAGKISRSASAARLTSSSSTPSAGASGGTSRPTSETTSARWCSLRIPRTARARRATASTTNALPRCGDYSLMALQMRKSQGGFPLAQEKGGGTLQTGARLPASTRTVSSTGVKVTPANGFRCLGAPLRLMP